jgi:hypothetical protein
MAACFDALRDDRVAASGFQPDCFFYSGRGGEDFRAYFSDTREKSFVRQTEVEADYFWFELDYEVAHGAVEGCSAGACCGFVFQSEFIVVRG